MKKFTFLIFVISIVLTGCSASKDILARTKEALLIANSNNFQQKLVKGGEFTLTTYQRIKDKSAPFVFYIEGDGHIAEGNSPSTNPTPVNPMLLRLAALDMRPNVVYIARPCQYTSLELNPKCVNNYWLDKRMGEEVVASINEVINNINNGQKFSLVGFSGGGGLAVLVAARNPNTGNIITIAGNLDIVKFNAIHDNRGYLSHSLNPINYAKKINNIPQLHLSGSEDKRVPAVIAKDYTKISNLPCVKQKTIPNNTHVKGWDRIWQSIYQTELTCY